MSAAHEDMTALAPAYVLGALDADERVAFEAHLATCDVCAAEVRSLTPVVDAIGRAVTQANPSLGTRRRVVDAVTRAAAMPPVPQSIAPQPAARRSAVATWLPYAALLLVGIGLGSYAAALRGRINDLELRLDETQAQLAAATTATTEARRVAFQAQSIGSVLAAADLVRIDLAGQPSAPQSSARALWSRTRGMVFTASNLPPLPPGRTYQVWVVTADAPVSAGLLTADDAGRGVGVFATSPDIAPIAVAVTIEPDGGMPKPTSDPFLVGKPSAG